MGKGRGEGEGGRGGGKGLGEVGSKFCGYMALLFVAYP